MKIAFINPAGGLGGGELSLLDLLASLGESAPQVGRVLIATAEGPLLERAEALGVETHLLRLPKRAASLGDFHLAGRGRISSVARLAARGLPAAPAGWSFIRALRRRLQKTEPTVIHTNGLKAHLLVRLAGPSGIPVVWHVRDFPGARPVMASALRWASKRAAGAIAISEAVARDVKSIAPGLPVRTIYNAVDVSRFRPEQKPGDWLDREAGLSAAPTGSLRVGLVAAFARWKGQDTFIDAAAKVDPRRNVRFYVIGSPIYETRGSQFSLEELRERAARAGLTDRLGFVPFQADAATVFQSLDVAVHASSRPEPFGRTIVEALACGKPTIVSAAGGAVELFRDGLDAVGFTPGSSAELAALIEKLAGDPDLRRELARAGRDSAVARFSRDRLAADLLKTYADLGIPGF